MLSDPLVVVAKVTAALDALDIRYIVGGSLASSLYGIPRATQDVDLVAKLTESHAQPLVEELRSDFYIDAYMITDAVQRGGSFNVIHLGTMYKADVFVMKTDQWSIEEMRRGRVEPIMLPEGPARVRFASPEDTLLHKLVWYRMGGEVSGPAMGRCLGNPSSPGRRTRLELHGPICDVS